MLFNSIEYLIYLPIVFLLYWLVFGKRLRLQNLFVVVVSYLFYGWWDYRFLALIALTSFCSWLSGIGIEDVRARAGKIPRWFDKGIVVANVIFNLLILSFFKYYDFFVDSLVDAFSYIGISLHISTLSLLLPVGISFYTFQALSYTIDVYRGKLPVTRDIVSFFAFVSFFPQLVAGPIERATNLLIQFERPRSFEYNDAVDGIRQMMWGFFKKILIADNCALVVDDIFGNYGNYPASTLLLGAVLFSFQIYGDFSGYSDIAIGTAKLIGIQLRQNFRYPYFSLDIAEFWRRWHISLNTWFVDYVYIPLGGSHNGFFRHIRNILIIFFLSGLWHGANWTFVAWGVYHGLLCIALLILKKYVKIRLIPSNVVSMLVTFGFVVIGWILFRAENISMALDYIYDLFSSSLFRVPKVSGANNVSALLSLIFITCMLVIEWMNRKQPFGFDIRKIRSIYIRYTLYAILLFCIYFFGNNASSFIYFQF